MEIRFADIFKIYCNDKSFFWSPLKYFKLQCWDLIFYLDQSIQSDLRFTILLENLS